MRVRAYYKIASTPVKANPFSVHFGWWIETPCSTSPVVVKPHFITKHDKLKMEIKNTKKKKKSVDEWFKSTKGFHNRWKIWTRSPNLHSKTHPNHTSTVKPVSSGHLWGIVGWLLDIGSTDLGQQLTQKYH